MSEGKVVGCFRPTALSCVLLGKTYPLAPLKTN
jgi:hypothetical protein